TRVHITPPLMYLDQFKPEVHLVVEQAGPTIRAGAPQEYETIVGINFGESNVPRAFHLNPAGAGLGERSNSCHYPNIDCGRKISPKKIFTEANDFRRERIRIRNVLLIGIVRKRYRLTAQPFDLFDI